MRVRASADVAFLCLALGGLGCSPASAPSEGRTEPNALDSTAVGLTEAASRVWAEEAKLLPSHFAAPHFGNAVATDGSWAVVGAPGDGNDASRTASGAAYVFNYYRGDWIRTAKLLASDATAGDRFGESVAISGETIVVGAPGDDGARGSAYVFVSSGGGWVEQQRLVALDRAASDVFGASVSVSADTVAIGSPGDDGARGSAHVFVRSGSSFLDPQRLVASDGAAGAEFACSLSVSGNTLLVGAHFAASPATNSGAAYAFTRATTSFGAERKLVAYDGASDDWFGRSVSLSGDRAIVGAPGDDDRGLFSGSAYTFRRSGADFVSEQKLSAGDGAANDYFGTSVSIAGDRAIAGAPRSELEIFPGAPRGSAYAFSVSVNIWSLERKFQASDGEPAELFGHSVAISASTWSLVGARRDDDRGDFSGSAYVFTAATSEYRKLSASDAGARSSFGQAASLSGDTAIVGAPGDDAEGVASGSAYVFERNETSWLSQAKLSASDAAAGHEFGCSVSVDGDSAVIGARGHDDLGADSGAAYVFVRGATTFDVQEKLYAVDGASGDAFGSSVSISGDTVLVGAPEDDDRGLGSGSVYVFVRATAWTSQQKIAPDDLVAGDFFGSSGALFEDTALIGAPGDDGGEGAAYLFERTGGVWAFVQKLATSDSGLVVGFGSSVSLSSDTAIVGAPRDGGTGAVYTFLRTTTGWVEQQRLEPSDGASQSEFGHSVSLSGDTILIGSGTGFVEVFQRNQPTWAFLERLLPSDGAAGDQFGTAVAVSSGFAVVGARGDDDQGEDSGSVYAFSAACPLGVLCESGTCKDGVCCDVPCNGTCQRCDATPGACTTVTNAEDSDTCAGTRACDASGACKLKNGEVCSSATECASGHCVDERCCDTACDGGGCDVCNATPGTCKLVLAGAEGSDPSCAPYVCDGSSPSCPTSCADDGDCVRSAYCDVSDSLCRPDQPDGSTCSASSQCESAHCVDGHCCDGPCDEICQACAALLKETGDGDGVCGDARSGRDPHDDCMPDASDCGQDGQCDGSGACRLQTRGTSCGTGASCSDNLAIGQVCDGLGACSDEPDGIDCSPYRCPDGESGCKIPCAGDADCTSDAHCDVGECRAKLDLGVACATDAECRTDFCVDGVCCDGRCAGPCEACNVAGAKGTCIAVLRVVEGETCSEKPDDCAADGTCTSRDQPVADDDAGCGCRAGRQPRTGGAAAFLMLALALLARGRRRTAAL